MKSKHMKSFLFAASLLLAVSCSVKEDRTVCPCWVEVHFADRSEIIAPVNLYGFSENNEFNDVFRAELHSDYYLKEVVRDHYHFVSTTGSIRNQRRHDKVMLIEYGCQADSVYWHHDEVSAVDEEAKITVDFTKQFATVFLDIHKEEGDMTKYSFFAESNVCGFDIITGEPVQGAFSCQPSVVPGGTVSSFRLPRQIDSSLSLKIVYDDGEGHAASSVYPLGEYISTLGYDWNTPDLGDLYISIDIVGGRINIGVSDWEHPSGSDFGNVEI